MKRRYVLHFPPESVNHPVTYTLVKDYNIKVNILNADLSSGQTSRLVIDMHADEEKITRALDYLEAKHVSCEELKYQLEFKNDACISCGACTAVCFSGALTLDPVTWNLHFNSELCVICGLCVKACPLGLFNIDYNRYV